MGVDIDIDIADIDIDIDGGTPLIPERSGLANAGTATRALTPTNSALCTGPFGGGVQVGTSAWHLGPPRLLHWTLKLMV